MWEEHRIIYFDYVGIKVLTAEEQNKLYLHRYFKSFPDFRYDQYKLILLAEDDGHIFVSTVLQIAEHGIDEYINILSEVKRKMVE